MKHFRFEKAVIKYLNTKWITNEGYEIKIIEYFDYNNCTIQFSNSKINKYKVKIQAIQKGEVKNTYHPSVYNVGYIGEGKYKPSINSKDTKVYKHWSSMLQRGCSPALKEKHPTYKDVTVCEEWHNFQNFAKWYEVNWKPWMDSKWQLDKDILCPECKIYSPETCCFVPNEINIVFIKPSSKKGTYPIGVSKHRNKFQVSLSINGVSNFLGGFKTPEEAFQVYKTAKEQYVKEVSDRWKDLIDQRVYEAMYNYKVEING